MLLDFNKFKRVVGYIVDLNLPLRHYAITESYVYLDENDLERVIFSSSLYNNDKGDLLLSEYLNLNAFETSGKKLAKISHAEYDLRVSQYQANLTADIKKISSDDFHWKRCVLPPEKWCKVNGVEVFYIPEYIQDNYVTWLALYNDLYFELVERATCSPDFIANKIIGHSPE